MVIKGEELDICFYELDDKYLSVKDTYFAKRKLSIVMKCIEDILCEELDNIYDLSAEIIFDAMIDMIQKVRNSEWSENG